MLKRTVFFEDHVNSGAKMVDFGGWEMPIQYAGLAKEHAATRSSVGLFDVSHMGEIWVEGKDALEAVRYLVSNSVDIADGEAQYTCLCNHEGGIVDDLIVYRFTAEKLLLCVNAANREKDFDWVFRHNPFPQTVTITNASDDYAQVAVQGRYAEKTVQKLTSYNLASIEYYHFAVAKVGDVEDCIIARTGYTGEDGFEIFIPVHNAKGFWSLILDAGEEFGIQPIGLGARDTLRLEARMNLYGNDMTDDTKPHESGVFWTVDTKKEDFIGKKAILDHKESHWKQRLVGLVVEKRIPRPHCAVEVDGQVIGEITSGTKSPSLKQGIALARISRRFARVGTELEVDVRGKKAKARVVQGSFYKRDY